MKRHSMDDLIAFVGRADTQEKVQIARDYISRLAYLTTEEQRDLDRRLDDKLESLLPNDADDPWLREDFSERDYGPSNPWDAPGMKVSDFIRGVKSW